MDDTTRIVLQKMSKIVAKFVFEKWAVAIFFLTKMKKIVL